jgi:hypothetical protein
MTFSRDTATGAVKLSIVFACFQNYFLIITEKKIVDKIFFSFVIVMFLMSFSSDIVSKGNTISTDPVDYVKPYMGNISHLLVPTFPTMSRCSTCSVGHVEL